MRMLAGLLVGVVGLGGRGFGQGTGPVATGTARPDAGLASGKRPMTFADLQKVKRIDDPQISPSGKWVMFSAVDVDLARIRR